MLIPLPRTRNKNLFLVHKFHFRWIPRNFREYHRNSRKKLGFPWALLVPGKDAAPTWKKEAIFHQEDALPVMTLLSTGHFPEKSPIISGCFAGKNPIVSGSFAENNLRGKTFYHIRSGYCQFFFLVGGFKPNETKRVNLGAGIIRGWQCIETLQRNAGRFCGSTRLI